MPLEKEQAAYARDKAKLIADGNEGQWVTYVGEERLGVYGSFEDGLKAGFDRVGPATDFLVKQIVLVDPVFFMNARVIPCPK